MSIYEMFVEMWELDFQMGLFDKAYFQERVRQGQLKAEDYQKIVGEAYVEPQAQSQPEQPQA